MDASAQQIVTLATPPAPPGGPAELPSGQKRFTDILGGAMEKSISHRETEPTQARQNQTADKQEPPNKPLETMINPQTPAIATVPTNSNDKLPPAAIEGQGSGIENDIENDPQRSARAVKILESLGTCQFQSGAMGTQHLAKDAAGRQRQPVVSRAPGQEDQDQGNLSLAAKGFPNGPSFHISSPAVENQPASGKGLLLPWHSNHSVPSPTNSPSESFPEAKQTSVEIGPSAQDLPNTREPKQTSATNSQKPVQPAPQAKLPEEPGKELLLPSHLSHSVPSPTNSLSELFPEARQIPVEIGPSAPNPPNTREPKQTSATNDQPQVQSAPQAKVPEEPWKPLQKALAETENLRLEFFSSTTSQNVTPLPRGPQRSRPLNLHVSQKRTTTRSTEALHQRQEPAAPQNCGKDSGGSGHGVAQDADKVFAPNAPTASSAGNPARDGKPGQDNSGRHTETIGPQSSGNTAGSRNFNSTTPSTTATIATAISIAPGQAASTHGATANVGPKPRPAISHAVAAEKLAADVESPLKATAGVINMASMLQSRGKTEMRVAIQTKNLGPLELHAVLHGGRLGASIAVGNNEAHTLLTNNLPSLQQVLNDRNLPVEHLSVLNASTSSGTNTGSHGGSQSGGQPQTRPNTPWWAFSPPVQVGVGHKSDSVIESLRGRLSVHA